MQQQQSSIKQAQKSIHDSYKQRIRHGGEIVRRSLKEPTEQEEVSANQIPVENDIQAEKCIIYKQPNNSKTQSLDPSRTSPNELGKYKI